MVFVVQKGQMVVIMRWNSWRWGWCGDWNWNWFDSSTSGAASTTTTANDVTAATASGIRYGFGGIIAVPWFRMTTVGWKADLVCPITMASTNWVGILLVTKNGSILVWFPMIKFPVIGLLQSIPLGILGGKISFKDLKINFHHYDGHMWLGANLHWKITWNIINLQIENRFLLNLGKWEKTIKRH